MRTPGPKFHAIPAILPTVQANPKKDALAVTPKRLRQGRIDRIMQRSFCLGSHTQWLNQKHIAWHSLSQ
jgi:hypothetical protein